MRSGAVLEAVTVVGDLLRTVQTSQIADWPPAQYGAVDRTSMNLQQRAAGVLPIRVDVPRAGMSHEFIKPLVVGDETTVRLRYRRN